MANLLKYDGVKDVRKPIPNILLPHFARWQSNNSPTDLGIVRFAFDILEPLLRDFNRKYGVAPWARIALAEFLQYNPNMVREDRCHSIATFRGGSKTTWFSLILELYFILIGQYGIYCGDYLLPEADYLVLKAKTGNEGKKRLFNISSILHQQAIVDQFGELKPSIKQVKDKMGKDQSSLMILTNGYIIEAMGIAQPIRGANLLSVRPKGIIYDDPEHLENTHTAERRRKNEDDVLEEAYGALHEENGFMIYIGNKVHEDDMLGKLLTNSTWKHQFYTLTYKDADGIERSSWEARFTMDRIKKIYKKYASHGQAGLKAYYKNYYNKIVSETEYFIKYYDGEYIRQHGTNWIKLHTETGVEYRNVWIVIGLDPAISENEKSSDATVTVLAIDGWGERYVLEQYAGKFDQRDRYFESDYRPMNGVIALSQDEIIHVRRMGSAELSARMYLKYHADGLTIETAGQQRGFFNDVADIFFKLNMYPQLLDSTPTINKIIKLTNCPLNYFEVGRYHIKKEMNGLENEVNTFPFSKLDRLDSLHLAEQLAQIPHKLTWTPLGLASKFLQAKETDIYENPPKDFEAWVVL